MEKKESNALCGLEAPGVPLYRCTSSCRKQATLALKFSADDQTHIHATRARTSTSVYQHPKTCRRCLSFDNGLAGALHIAPQTTESGFPLPFLSPLASEGEEEGQFSPRNMVLALLGSLLARPPGTDCAANNTPTARTDDEATRSVSDVASNTEEQRVGLSGSSLTHGRGAGGGVSVGLEAVVVDDDSPFVGLFGELELLERVCDADWVRFEPLATCSSGASGAPAVVAPVPLSALVLNP